MKNLINENERIFIAGGAGMVGSAINRILIKKGYGEISKGGIILNPNRKELNLENFNEVNAWFNKYKPTVVIIAAAKVGGINSNSTYPYDFIIRNLKIQNNIIENSYLYNIKRLLFLGSSCIYPKFSPQPILEEYLLTNSLEATNEFYAIAKISGLKLCESLCKQHNFDAISLMPTNLYGPNDNYDLDNSHVLPALIKKFVTAKKNNLKEVTCWGTGTPLREFLFVDDLAECCIHALEKWKPKSENSPLDSKGNHLYWLNVGSEFEISIKDLATKIANLCNYDGNIFWDKSKPDGTPRKKLDTSKMRALGWVAETNLEKGIQITIKDFIHSKRQ